MKPLTTGEAARICNVSPPTIIKCCDLGLLRHYRIPGSTHRRIPAGWLLRFAREHGLGHAVAVLESLTEKE